MPFDWKGFLSFAHNLQQQAATLPEPEPLLRSAVSRAYFGTYCHARNYAKDYLKFNPREDADDHGRLRAHLKDRRRKGDADRLEQLRQLRNNADYLNDLPWTDAPATVVSALAFADSVFKSLVPPKKT
jgi:hypothetical protein